MYIPSIPSFVHKCIYFEWFTPVARERREREKIEKRERRKEKGKEKRGREGERISIKNEGNRNARKSNSAEAKD